MLRYSWLVLGASTLGVSALHVSAGDQRLAVVVPTHRGDLDLAVQSMTRWPHPAICSTLTEQNMDLVLYYAGGEEDEAAVSEAADTVAETAGRCFSSMRTVFADLDKKDDIYPKAPSIMFYKMFLDDDVRSHLSDYDALAIIEWDVLVATERSFEELYHAAFRVNEEFWVKGSNLEGTTFHASAEMAGMWQVLGHINGNAIYNNNDPAFIEYVDYTRARWQYQYPYDVALWLTISDFPHSWPLYQRYSNKFVTTNLIAYVGHEIVDHSGVSDAIAGHTLFIHGSGVQGGSKASIMAVQANKTSEARRRRRKLRAGSDGMARRLADECDVGCEVIGTTTGRICDTACADGADLHGCPTVDYAEIGYSAATYGTLCRACFVDEALAASVDPDAITCDEYDDPYRRRLLAPRDESAPHVARILEEVSSSAAENSLRQGSSEQMEDEEEGTASFFAEAAKRPFTDDLARGNLCAFIAGRADDADLSRATVMSVLSFNPGVRVAVAAEDAGLGDYERAVGGLPGVTVSGTTDVITASLFADEYCGADARLILYLKAGSLVTRPFTAKDTHSPKGDVLVVYTGALAGFQRDELARETELVLGSEAPSFTHGTDLLLPVRANQDLRKLVLRPSDGAGGDPELVEEMRPLTDLDDVFAVPQAMATHAKSRSIPGVWFINPQEWVARNLFKAASIWDIPLLKPRFTCAIDPALQRSEISNEVLAAELKSNLDFFSKGGTCESGMLDIHPPVY